MVWLEFFYGKLYPIQIILYKPDFLKEVQFTYNSPFLAYSSMSFGKHSSGLGSRAGPQTFWKAEGCDFTKETDRKEKYVSAGPRSPRVVPTDTKSHGGRFHMAAGLHR